MIKFKYKFYSAIELEKLFVDLGTSRKIVVTKSHSVMKELMKILALHETCNSNIPHWLDETVSFIMDVVNSDFSPAMSFLPLEDNLVAFPKGFDKLEIFKKNRGKINGSSEDLVNNILNILSNQTEKGQNKYREVLKLEMSKVTFPEPQVFFDYLKYIAFCFSGQLDPEIDLPYSSEVYDGTKVKWENSFEPISKLTPEKIRKRLIKCLENIFGESKGLK